MVSNLGKDRQIIQQTWASVAIVVPATPGRVPLSDVAQSAGVLQVDSIIISLHPDAGTILYLGKANVIGGAASNGLAIDSGEKVQFAISNERPLYEIQSPLIAQACIQPLPIPLVVWNLSDMWLTADAETTAVIQFFDVAWR